MRICDANSGAEGLPSIIVKLCPGAMCYNDCSSDVAEGPTLAGTIDYAALASALAGVLTLAIMIWIAYAGRS